MQVPTKNKESQLQGKLPSLPNLYYWPSSSDSTSFSPSLVDSSTLTYDQSEENSIKHLQKSSYPTINSQLECGSPKATTTTTTTKIITSEQYSHFSALEAPSSSTSSTSPIIEIKTNTSSSNNTNNLFAEEKDKNNRIIIMTQDEQHLDSSQQSSSQINQRSNSVENNQIIIDDDTINNTSSSKITTIDGKLNQNTEIENFNKDNNSNGNENSGDDSFEETLTTTTKAALINDINDNIEVPIPENKTNNDTVLVNISNKPHNIIVTTSEKQHAVNSQLLNENETIIKFNHNDIVSLHIQEDCLPNNTNIVLVEQSPSSSPSSSSSSSTKETTSNSESNEFKQIESRDTLNKTVLSIETANDSKIKNTEKLEKQETLINDFKNNIIQENNNKSNGTILNSDLENNKDQIIRENKIIKETINQSAENNKLNEYSVINDINDSPDGSDNTNSVNVLNNNEKLDLINLNDNLITNNTSDNDNNNKNELNLNLNTESKDKNQLNAINAKNNEVNENEKEAQGIKNSQNQQLNIKEEQIKYNLNFNELNTNKLFDNNNEIKSLNKNNLIDGQIDNKTNQSNNNNSTKTNAIKYKFSKQKTLSQDEDPIVRLNRLRANISNVLREVKGVIRQYSSEQSIEIEDKYIRGNSSTSKRASNTTIVPKSKRQQLQKTENVIDVDETEEKNQEMAPVADDNKPVKFRFVRKTRRNSNHSDAEDQSIQIEESKNRNNLETNELSHENLNDNQTKNKKEIVEHNNNNIKSGLENDETILKSDNNIKEGQINENINKKINNSAESQKANLNLNNFSIKENLIEKETDEKVKKKIDNQSPIKELAKISAESAEKKVKKLLVKKTILESNTTDNNNNHSVHKIDNKPKIIKKIQKVNSLDKEELNATVNEKSKRPIFRKQISLDEKLAKEQEKLFDNSSNKLSDIKELLIGTEVIPIIKPSINITKVGKELNATSSKTKTNNLIQKNSKSLSKSKEQEKPQTDLNLVTNNDKILEISNQSQFAQKESDDFTILRSREVIVSKVIVPQGSLEFDNPELIEFDKGDCSKITEIRSADNSIDSTDKKLKLLKSMTISENSLKIDRRASVATTDAKKIQGEYKQKIDTDDTMKQRRLSHSGNLKAVPLIKADADFTKTAIKNQSTATKAKKEITVEANQEKKLPIVKQTLITNVTPVISQKPFSTHTKDATKNVPTNSEAVVKKPSEKDVKNKVITPKETSDQVVKSSAVQQKKAVTSSTLKNAETKIVTTKEPIVHKITVEAKKPKIPKTFVVTKAKDDHPPPHLILVKDATSSNNIQKDLKSHSTTSNERKDVNIIGTSKNVLNTSGIASGITSIKNIEITAPIVTPKQISNKESSNEESLHFEKPEVEVKTDESTVSTINSTNLQIHESTVSQQTETKLIPKNEEPKIVLFVEQKSHTAISNTSSSLPTKSIEETDDKNQTNEAKQENESPLEILEVSKETTEENISSRIDSLISNTEVSQTLNIEEKSETSSKTEVKDQIENEIISNELLSENARYESSHSENETTEDDHFESGSTTETTDTDTTGAHKTKTVKKRRAFKKVVIKRIKRRLSISDGPLRPISPTSAEAEIPEICEKEIYKSDVEEHEEDEIKDEQDEEIKKGPKPCIRPRAFEIDEPVLYGERYKKTQVKWRKARIVERITSISYKIHFGSDEEDKSVHLSYLKRDNGKKISFGGKEYLEIDYAQIEAEEEKYNRPYSIWDRA